MKKQIKWMVCRRFKKKLFTNENKTKRHEDSSSGDKYKGKSHIDDTSKTGERIASEYTQRFSIGDRTSSHGIKERSGESKVILRDGGYDHSMKFLTFTETERFKKYGDSTSPGSDLFETDTRQPLPRAQTPDEENCYKFNHARRGYMICIVNNCFYGDDDKREGGFEDYRKMKDIGRKFRFDMFNTDLSVNLTKPQLQKLLRRAQQTDHSECDCFIFMISTHGESLPRTYTDGEETYGLLCSDGQIVEIREIISAFIDVNCPTLKDKPKLFFIQACRGLKTDDGCRVRVLKQGGTNYGKSSMNTSDTWDANGSQEALAKPYISSDSIQTRPDVSNSPYLTCDNDMLVMFAAPLGMCAWRNEGRGSWMIQDLHGVLMEYDFRKPKSLLRLLTKVAGITSSRVTKIKNPDQNGKVIVPVIENKLTKDVLF